MAITSTGESTSVPWADPDEDYIDEPPRRPVRKPFGPGMLILLALVIAAAAFYGGVTMEKGKIPATSTGSAAAARSRAAAASGATGASGAAGAAATPVRGTITLVDGSTVYVTDSSGNVIKVTTTPASAISVTSSGTVQKLHPGDNVTVVGPADADGNVTATALADTGTGTGGGFAGRRSTAPTGTATGGGGGGFGGGGGGGGAGGG